MAPSSANLTWCIVELSEDMNWWVSDITDKAHWDLDGLGILDPKQVSHILDLLDPLQEYGLDTDLVENAFFKFKIQKEMGNGKVQLLKTTEPLMHSEEPLFALPDLLDEDKSAYADFLGHITSLRVKMLNDTIDFEQALTIDELEEELKEAETNRMMEDTHIHAFEEITSILEYLPAGYEMEQDEEKPYSSEVEDEGVDFASDEESLEEDDTMRWGNEEEEEEEEGEDLDDDDDDEDDEEDDDEDEEDDEEKKESAYDRKKYSKF